MVGSVCPVDVDVKFRVGVRRLVETALCGVPYETVTGAGGSVPQPPPVPRDEASGSPSVIVDVHAELGHKKDALKVVVHFVLVRIGEEPESMELPAP